MDSEKWGLPVKLMNYHRGQKIALFVNHATHVHRCLCLCLCLSLLCVSVSVCPCVHVSVCRGRVSVCLGVDLWLQRRALHTVPVIS